MKTEKKSGEFPNSPAIMNKSAAKIQQNHLKVNGIAEVLVDESKNTLWFWKVAKKSKTDENEEEQVTACEIDHLGYINFLHFYGYRRWDVDDDYTFLQVRNKRIRAVPLTEIQDFVIQYINDFFANQPKNYTIGVSKKMVLSKIYQSPQTYFSKSKLSLIGSEEFEFNSDSEDAAFFYYQNGFVEVNKAGIFLKDYKSLSGYIWENQILDRIFNPKANEEGNFKKFVQNIAGKKETRFESIRTILGYGMHHYYNYKRKAINFTDSTIGVTDEGRSGKSLLGMALSKIRNTVTIGGKNFDTTNRKKYMSLNLDTQIVFLNDIKKRFNLESLYNDITDGIEILKHFKDPYTIHAKMIISSNEPFVVDSGSKKDRIIEFEFSDHYHQGYGPDDEFGQWFFGSDWSVNDWDSFDMFMLNCSHEFLLNGIIYPEELNLSARKLLNETNQEFLDFMDECINGENSIIHYGVEFVVKDLFNKFIAEYPDYSQLKVGTFTKYLRTFANHKKIEMSERRTNGIAFRTYHI